MYPVYCSWCLQQGKKKIVRWSTVENSHGICRKHKKEQDKLIAEL